MIDGVLLPESSRRKNDIRDDAKAINVVFALDPRTTTAFFPRSVHPDMCEQ